MKLLLRCLLVLACVSLLSAESLFAQASSPAPAVPANLEVPAGQKLILTLTAKGVQIYECRAVADDPSRFEWAFKAPEADLFDAQGHQAGRHYAGPTWELTDGSKVIGRMKAKADAPDGKGVPWLLVEAANASGGGMLGRVQTIQRVSTVGGKAPTEEANAAKTGQQRRVDYTATYKFYADK